MKFSEFKELVKTNYNEIFPYSACTIDLGALGKDTFFVTYYLAGNQSEFPNKISQNDLFHISFHIMQKMERYGDGIKLEDDTELPETLVLDVHQKTIMTKPDNDYMAYGSISLPFRRTVGTPEKIIDTLKRYAEIVKKTLIELYEEDALPVNQQHNIKELVASKLGLNENKSVKTESIEITGTYEPHPEINKSYAYRLKHGLGGTLPNDVKIKKYDELNNGWVIVYLDRPLTKEELDFYDIPSETISMPEIDKFIDYNCMKDECKTESKLQEDDEVELQDVDNEDDEDIENDFDEVINDFKNTSDFYEFVVDDIEDDCEEYDGETLKDKMIARCDDISEHGCVSGMVSSLIYYSDTVAVFDKYADDIYDLIESYDPDTFLDVLKTHVNTTEIILNCDTSKNWIVWLAYEDVVFTLSEKLKEL